MLMPLDAAKQAIDRVFSDTTVSRDTTRERLGELRDHIDVCMDALDSDEDREAKDV